jgi:hypothetical protein
MVAEPESGRSSVARMESSVVLPAPFGPSRPKIAPLGTWRLAPRSASLRRRPNQPLRNVFVRSFASTASIAR